VSSAKKFVSPCAAPRLRDTAAHTDRRLASANSVLTCCPAALIPMQIASEAAHRLGWLPSAVIPGFAAGAHGAPSASG